MSARYSTCEACDADANVLHPRGLLSLFLPDGHIQATVILVTRDLNRFSARIRSVPIDTDYEVFHRRFDPNRFRATTHLCTSVGPS